MEAGAWSVITVSLFVKRNNNNTLQFLQDRLGGDHWEVVSGWTLWGSVGWVY